jgi:hypothetical protein
MTTYDLRPRHASPRLVLEGSGRLSAQAGIGAPYAHAFSQTRDGPHDEVG